MPGHGANTEKHSLWTGGMATRPDGINKSKQIHLQINEEVNKISIDAWSRCKHRKRLTTDRRNGIKKKGKQIHLQINEEVNEVSVDVWPRRKHRERLTMTKRNGNTARWHKNASKFIYRLRKE